MSKTVAFIGLGNMGGPMAANLVEAGFRVQGYDLSEDLLNAAAERGVEKASSATNAVAGARYVITMLPSDAAVESVYIDGTRLLAHIPEDALIIDCSTVSSATSKRLATQAKQRGLRAIDAPVSGGVAGAAAGTLSFMCGGDAEDVDSARELLSAMGANIFHAGAAGAGQTAKICNNMLLAIHMAGTAEALQLGVDNGLDPKVLSEIMLKSSGANWSLEKYNPMPGVMENVPASRDYSGGFQVQLMSKDLRLAQDTANASNSHTPLGSLVHNLFGLHGKMGNAGLDFSSIQQLFSRKIG
ncbi:3-hydroxyisobutyrate dehydrogenase [Microbulbifer marinus]|uniref:3-hydroxyisobutyrate dehydrogenase n=1 Tax=Microbulbifer marinus TaxID=658218 RepID=A0A1H3WW39_9GAMM|nr:3-hydroxyisobutyrate dehydrogenase [Microbulbifer marinus]